VVQRLPSIFSQTPKWKLDMCNSPLALAVVVCITLSQSASAKELRYAGSVPNAAGSLLGSQLVKLVHPLDIRLISRAGAAECTEEGETCTSTEQCCTGLECSGGSPATCTTED